MAASATLQPNRAITPQPRSGTWTPASITAPRLIPTARPNRARAPIQRVTSIDSACSSAAGVAQTCHGVGVAALTLPRRLVSRPGDPHHAPTPRAEPAPRDDRRPHQESSTYGPVPTGLI